MTTEWDNPVTDYWYEHYIEKGPLCGNHGVIDTTGIATPAGVVVGRQNYCICPNGQCMRKHDAVIGVAVPIKRTR